MTLLKHASQAIFNPAEKAGKDATKADLSTFTDDDYGLSAGQWGKPDNRADVMERLRAAAYDKKKELPRERD